VKRELDRLGLDYRVVDADADMRAEVIRLSGQRAIPILAIGDEVLVDSVHIIRQLRRRYTEAA
jgi:glutathione S-transferase